MIKYLVKYIKSVKQYISSRSDEKYKFGENLNYLYFFKYFNQNNFNDSLEYFEIYNCKRSNKTIKIYYFNNILNKPYCLYLPISYKLLVDNLK